MVVVTVVTVVTVDKMLISVGTVVMLMKCRTVKIVVMFVIVTLVNLLVT